MTEWTNSALQGVAEEERGAVQSGDRQRNTLATPEWLATITTCCICGQPLVAGDRYTCLDCR